MPNIPEIKSKILSFIQKNGPSIPVHISKEIRENMIFTGAVLSELISNKKLLVSNAKIGSSPVYYLAGQEYKLSQVLHSHLKDVYKKAHDLLKENIILKDSELEPWQRVALRELRDFAVMLTTHDGNIFWKWYLTSDEAAELLIKKYLGLIPEEKTIEKQENLKEKPLEEFEKKAPEVPNINPTEKDVEKIEEAVEKITGIKPLPREHKYSTKRVLQKKSREEKPVEEERQQTLPKELDFGELSNFFKNKKITILNQKQIGKKEFNFTGEMHSALGIMKVFVKFKDKKKISDSDFITAHNESGKMPLYFISHGEMTKKAEDYIRNNFLIYEKLK